MVCIISYPHVLMVIQWIVLKQMMYGTTKKSIHQKAGMSEEDIDFEYRNWLLLDAKRITVPT